MSGKAVIRWTIKATLHYDETGAPKKIEDVAIEADYEGTVELATFERRLDTPRLIADYFEGRGDLEGPSPAKIAEILREIEERKR